MLVIYNNSLSLPLASNASLSPPVFLLHRLLSATPISSFLSFLQGQGNLVLTMPDPSSTRKPYFGLKGGWLTFWITIACATDMTLFGYDQVVFGVD